ncbi:DUF952 domain-containing protein [Fulvimarina sp. 2208YS6-2-32]|uniref:DUF952 domain-containing protein n=1 Tax=Fulvimarina uroteuthidis TaxID=3098149 RepID=A0ABU5HY93_9HYPH|nr:DUF952 domain-containing protein [Fulvimarina sp. 2208YS6-2-32]MDY8107936.1 DUF952 domain-containing protein [Fulvimarina sp. 2208YS6-2-32]
MNEMIYKIMTRAEWNAFQSAGVFTGAPVDLADGYIHFSTGGQAPETASRHFAGQEDLWLVAVDPALLGDALTWEPSRGGVLFPHLYAALALDQVALAEPLPLGDDGRHRFPSGVTGPAA